MRATGGPSKGKMYGMREAVDEPRKRSSKDVGRPGTSFLRERCSALLFCGHASLLYLESVRPQKLLQSFAESVARHTYGVGQDVVMVGVIQGV